MRSVTRLAAVVAGLATGGAASAQEVNWDLVNRLATKLFKHYPPQPK